MKSCCSRSAMGAVVEPPTVASVGAIAASGTALSSARAMTGSTSMPPATSLSATAPASVVFPDSPGPANQLNTDARIEHPGDEHVA